MCRYRYSHLHIKQGEPEPELQRLASSLPEDGRAVHQESSCPAHAHRARASCLPDSNPYGRDGLAHRLSLSTARRALRVA